MDKIPKVIHYCWFGGHEKPKLINKCMETWKHGKGILRITK